MFVSRHFETIQDVCIVWFWVGKHPIQSNCITTLWKQYKLFVSPYQRIWKHFNNRYALSLQFLNMKGQMAWEDMSSALETLILATTEGTVE